MRFFQSIVLVIYSLGLAFLFGCSTGAEVEGLASRKAIPIIIGDGSGVVEPGKDLELNWQVTADQPKTVLIEVSYDGGKTWVVIESNYINSGTYNFSVVDVPGAEFRVRVIDVDKNVIAESEATKIEGTTPTIAVNDDKSSFSPAEVINLTWQTNSDQPSVLALERSLDGGQTFTLISNISNTGSYAHSGPHPPGETVFRIVDPTSGLVYAQTGKLLIVSGYPGMAITSGGGTAKSTSYKVQATIEPVYGQILKNNDGVVRAQVNLIGVAE